jgi:hypothetical protein
MPAGRRILLKHYTPKMSETSIEASESYFNPIVLFYLQKPKNGGEIVCPLVAYGIQPLR